MTQVALEQNTANWRAQLTPPAHNDNTPARPSGRRGLVLTDESAKHPFRAKLPPNVRREVHDIPAESLWRLTMDDVRGFASVYLAATAGVLTFII